MVWSVVRQLFKIQSVLFECLLTYIIIIGPIVSITNYLISRHIFLVAMSLKVDQCVASGHIQN